MNAGGWWYDLISILQLYDAWQSPSVLSFKFVVLSFEFRETVSSFQVLSKLETGNSKLLSGFLVRSELEAWELKTASRLPSFEPLRVVRTRPSLRDLSLFVPYPALKRWATLVCPSG